MRRNWTILTLPIEWTSLSMSQAASTYTIYTIECAQNYKLEPVRVLR